MSISVKPLPPASPVSEDAVVVPTSQYAAKESAAPCENDRRLRRHVIFGLAALPLLTLLDQALVSGGNFITTVILGRTCSEAQLGLYGKGMSVVVLLTSIPMALIWTPYNVYSSDMAPQRLASYRASVLVLLLAIAAIASSALLGIGLFADDSLRGLLLALSFVAVFLLLREHARRLSFARLDMKSAIRLDGLVSGLQIATLATMAGLGWLSGANAFYAIGLACAIGIAALPWLWKPAAAVRPARVRSDLKRNWQMSKFIFAGSVLFTCSNGAYPWVLGYFADDAAVGRLTAAGMAIFLANPLLIAATNYFGPSMVHTQRESGPAGVYRTAVACTFGIGGVMLLFCVAMYFFGGWFVETVFSKSYAGLDGVVMSLALAQVVNAMLIPLRAGLFALDQGHLMVKGGLLRMACLATIGIYAVRTWGPVGVGVGMLSGDFAALLMKTCYLRLLARQSPKPSGDSQPPGLLS